MFTRRAGWKSTWRAVVRSLYMDIQNTILSFLFLILWTSHNTQYTTDTSTMMLLACRVLVGVWLRPDRRCFAPRFMQPKFHETMVMFEYSHLSSRFRTRSVSFILLTNRSFAHVHCQFFVNHLFRHLTLPWFLKPAKPVCFQPAQSFLLVSLLFSFHIAICGPGLIWNNWNARPVRNLMMDQILNFSYDKYARMSDYQIFMVTMNNIPWKSAYWFVLPGRYSNCTRHILLSTSCNMCPWAWKMRGLTNRLLFIIRHHNFSIISRP